MNLSSTCPGNLELTHFLIFLRFFYPLAWIPCLGCRLTLILHDFVRRVLRGRSAGKLFFKCLLRLMTLLWECETQIHLLPRRVNCLDRFLHAYPHWCHNRHNPAIKRISWCLCPQRNPQDRICPLKQSEFAVALTFLIYIRLSIRGQRGG